MHVYTIGFTRKSAEQVFELIRAGARSLTAWDDYAPRYLGELRERRVAAHWRTITRIDL